MMNPLALANFMRQAKKDGLDFGALEELASSMGMDLRIQSVETRDEIPVVPPGSQIVKMEIGTTGNGTAQAFALFVFPPEQAPPAKRLPQQRPEPDNPQPVYNFA